MIGDDLGHRCRVPVAFRDDSLLCAPASGRPFRHCHHGFREGRYAGKMRLRGPGTKSRPQKDPADRLRRVDIVPTVPASAGIVARRRTYQRGHHVRRNGRRLPALSFRCRCRELQQPSKFFGRIQRGKVAPLLAPRSAVVLVTKHKGNNGF